MTPKGPTKDELARRRRAHNTSLFLERGAWIEWLNESRDTEPWKSARKLAETIARGAVLTAKESREIVAKLEDTLDAGWLAVRPRLMPIGTMIFGKTEDASGFRPGADIFVPDYDPEDPAGLPGDRDELQLLKFFLFLVNAKYGRQPGTLRVCQWPGCDTLFVDMSRGQNARFCSSSCRNRANREG